MREWWRRLAERLSRGVVLRRTLPDHFQNRKILVTPDARLAYWRRDLERVEPDLLRWAEELVEEGMTVWDVGANVGVFSFASAVRAGSKGRVIALEPDPALLRLLHRSARLGTECPEAPVRVLPLAAGQAEGLVELRVAQRGRASNFLRPYGGGSQSGGTREAIQVLAVRLDWLETVLEPPDLLKVDVEGAEVAVLGGARNLLAEHRPLLLVEVYERNREEIGSLLNKAGYQLFDAAFHPPGERGPLSVPVHDTLAVHSDDLPQERWQEA